MVGVAAIGLGTPAAAQTGTASIAAQNSAEIQQELDRVLGSSPTDAELIGVSGLELVKEAVRCADLDGLVFCLQLGWVDAPPSDEELASRIGPSLEVEPGGDLGLLQQVEMWAGLPAEERAAQEKAELDTAGQVVGYAKFSDHVVSGEPVPADFALKYPHVAEQVAEIPELTAINAVPSGSAQTINTSRTMKQPNSYFCGPTTMAIMSWNDPTGDRGHSPHVWADRLGTTEEGTAISRMVPATNQYLTWDTNRTGGAYRIQSIATFTDAQMRSIIQLYNGAYKRPIILHPQWKAAWNPHGRTTGGHFDLGTGYNYNNSADLVTIAEPAWSDTPNMMSVKTPNVLLANKNNINHKNIGI